MLRKTQGETAPGRQVLKGRENARPPLLAQQERRHNGGKQEGVVGPPAPGTEQTTALSPGHAHPKPALGSPLFLEVLPAKARATGQEGSPEGGGWRSVMTSRYKQLGTNSGHTRNADGKVDCFAFHCSCAAGRQTKKSLGWAGFQSGKASWRR